MGENSEISWTNHTFNPWIGCDRVSPGCDHCYAEAIDGRFGGGHWGPAAPRRFMNDAYWRKPINWNARAVRTGVRERVFCGSLCDWAEMRPDEVGAIQAVTRMRLWQQINATPMLDWLLLSKRPENWAMLLPWAQPGGGNYMRSDRVSTYAEPWLNVWLMVTGENSEQLIRRTEILRRTPAAVRGISAEPLLEHISAKTWDQALGRRVDYRRSGDGTGPTPDFPRIDWLIVGDESGSGARPAQPDWIRTAREAALRHGVAFHFKQWNGPTGGTVGITGLRKSPKSKVHLPVLDGLTWAQVPQLDRTS